MATKFLLFVYILRVFLNTVRGYVITTTVSPVDWTNPCGGGGGAMTSLEGSVELPVPPFTDDEHFQTINRIITKLREAKDKSLELRDIYEQERIQNTNLQNALENYHLDGFPVVSLTTEQNEEMRANLTKAHQFLYTTLSKVAVFLQALAEDEDTYEFGAYREHFSENKIKLYEILCVTGTLIRNLGSTIEEFVSTNIMDDKTRHITNTSARHMRDFVILKDTVIVYNTLTSFYIGTLGLF